MATFVDQTSYPALLGGAKCGDEKGMLGEPLLIHYQVGGPVWAGIYMFLTHLLMAVFISSFSHVPFVGESPAWLHATILIVTITVALFDHLGAYMVQPGKIQTLIDAVLIPLSLPGLVFFIAELYTVCSVWKAHALVCALLIILVVPSVAYKKITGKEAPTVYNDRLESFSTRSGLALHLAGDTSVGLWCVLCWAAMGYPPLMIWLQ